MRSEARGGLWFAVTIGCVLAIVAVGILWSRSHCTLLATGIAIMDWVTPVVHILGLGIAIWAFAKSRRLAYLLLVAYFALVVYQFLAMPVINRARSASYKATVSEEIQKEVNQASLEARQAVLKKYGLLASPTSWATQHVYIQVGPILLVAGLWFLMRQEKRKITEPQNRQVLSEPAPDGVDSDKPSS